MLGGLHLKEIEQLRESHAAREQTLTEILN